MEDNQLVQLALKRRILTSDQLTAAEKERQQLADRGIERSLWFMVQDLGMISDSQVRDLSQHVSSARVRALEIDGYIVQGRIGSGGMGDVFRGRNQDGHEVAIKLLSSKFAAHDEYARRFQREARATLRLHHPHITKSISAGEFEGQRYLIMELVQGLSLKEYIQRNGPIDPQHALLLIQQLANALSYAWREGVLHRDVKPANIILGHPRAGLDEPFCAKLCDFGLAKTMQGEDPTLTRGELTNSGVALGTPHYMSPEQASGEHDLDQRCDIYSLGASIYHALLGQTLYNGKSSAIIMYKQVNETLDLQPLRDRGIDAKHIKLLESMLAKNLNDRIATWEEVLKRLDALMPPKPQPAQQPPGTSSRPRPATSKKAMAAAPQPKRSALALVVAVTFLVTICATAAAFFAMHRGNATVFANPANFPAMLARAAKSGRATTMVVAAGEYQGPWHFGVAHSHVRVAADPGVRLVAPKGADANEPMVRLEPGLSDFSLRNVTIASDGRCAIEILPGAQAFLADIAIEGKCAQVLSAMGGDLGVKGLTAETDAAGIIVNGKARLALEDAQVTAKGTVLEASHAELELRHCQFTRAASGDSGRALIEINGGSVYFDTVLGYGADSGTGLSLDQVESCSIHTLSLSGLRLGVRAHRSTVTTLVDLKVQAYETGLEWVGAKNPQWSWKGFDLDAPKPVVGLAMNELESGAAGSLASQKTQ